jgi:hypothetical protein
MSLQKRWNDEIPAEIKTWGEEHLRADDPYRMIGDHAHELLGEADFAWMYSPTGRGAVCPVILALILVFQARERAGDRAAAEFAVRRLDWLYALHQPLNWSGFHHTDLVNFRKRLLAHGAEALIFEKVVALVQGLGFLKRVHMQRSDSTHILSYTEKLGRLELVWETLRLALRALEHAAPEWRAATLPDALVTAYSVRRTTWQLTRSEIPEAMVRAGRDGLWLLAQLDGTVPAEVQALPEIVALRSVWAQQFQVTTDEHAATHVELKKPGGEGKGKEIIVSPHDPDARWFKKRQTVWEGYKMHATETIDAAAQVQFLTDIELVAANQGDSEAIAGIQQRLSERDVCPKEHYVDQGYTSGTNLAESEQRGIELVGPIGLDTSKKPAGYRQADFKLDFEAGQATCPEGHTVALWLRGDPPGSQGSMADFKGHCTTCPARQVCASAGSSRKIQPGPYYEHREARRAEQQTAAFKERMKRRSAIEGTISELVRRYGVRQARYRGKAKVRLQMLMAGAAANLHRLAGAMRLQALAVST